MIVDCPHGAECPGCTYLGVDYAEQLEKKTAKLAAALAPHRELAAIAVHPARGADPVVGYRTRVKWVVGPTGEIGLYRDGRTHLVVDTPACRIAPPVFLDVAKEIREAWRKRGKPSAGLGAIDLREIVEGGERVAVTLVVDRGGDAVAARKLGEELAARDRRIVSVSINERDPGSPQLLGAKTATIVGPARALDRVGSVGVFASPGGFVQAHRGQALFIEQQLVSELRRLREAIGRAPEVLELFAGAGAFGLALAREGAAVTAVESHAPSVAAVRDAASAMGVSVDAVSDDAARFLSRAPRRFDMVVVDPPRRGLEPELRAAIARAKPRSVVYVSCEPETFARDLAHLARLGLAATDATPIDMIPLTAHVEALAVLEPAAPAPVRRLGEDAGVVFVEKPPHTDAFELGPAGGRALVEVEPGASGVVPFGTGPRRADAPLSRRIRVRCFVSGVARKRGHVRASGVDATYTRVAVLSGHSELVIEADLRHARGLTELLDRLATFGHAPLGDAKRSSRSALRHAFDVRAIDRQAVHVEWAAIGSGDRTVEATSALAPDLAVARARLAAQAR